jgi:hypothetical protein
MTVRSVLQTSSVQLIIKGGIVLASVQRDNVENGSGLDRLQRQLPVVFDLIVYLHSLEFESSRGQTCSPDGGIEVASVVGRRQEHQALNGGT